MHVPASAQRGQAFLFLLFVVLSVGLTILVSGASSEVSRSIKSDARVQALLVQAREALIGRAVADSNRPGSLPCPDTNDDGIADLLVGNNCPSYIGRLPWRTLGLGDIRDDAGERLWYALSPNFRDDNSVQINSDSKGDRTVYSGSTSTSMTTQAAAVIFAPGPAVGGQLRDATTTTCAATGTSILRSFCPNNYLEGSAIGVGNNASASGPYIVAPRTLTFNDRLVVLRTSDFMPLVERRVAGEMLDILSTYRSQEKAAATGGCDCFPWPDSDNNGSSNAGQNRGRIPITAAPHPWGTALTDPATGTVYTLPSLPSYFVPNNWANVIYYTVSKTSLQVGVTCTSCSASSTLSLNGSSGYGLFLITPGYVLPTQTRSTWAHYIDDPQNRDANPLVGDPAADDAYIKPVSKATNRDRIYTITAPPPNTQCTANAQSLISNAPCHTTGNNVKAACQQAASNLAGCTCGSAATAMITPPCRNTLNPPACQSAVTQLLACTS